MNKIIFSLSVKPAGRGLLSVYVNCAQYGNSFDVDTNVHVFCDEWDDENGLVINNPNARKLNILIRKTLYQLEEYELENRCTSCRHYEECFCSRCASHLCFSSCE